MNFILSNRGFYCILVMNFFAVIKIAFFRENAMSYIQDNLMPNEKILFFARVHPAVFIPAVVAFAGSLVISIYAVSTASHNDPTSGILSGFLVLVALGVFFASIILGFEALIMILTTEFAVTNRR